MPMRRSSEEELPAVRSLLEALKRRLGGPAVVKVSRGRRAVTVTGPVLAPVQRGISTDLRGDTIGLCLIGNKVFFRMLHSRSLALLFRQNLLASREPSFK